jgi:transmembrane protein DUF3566
VDHRVEPPSWLPEGAAQETKSPAGEEVTEPAPKPTDERSSHGHGQDKTYAYPRDGSYGYGQDGGHPDDSSSGDAGGPPAESAQDADGSAGTLADDAAGGARDVPSFGTGHGDFGAGDYGGAAAYEDAGFDSLRTPGDRAMPSYAGQPTREDARDGAGGDGAAPASHAGGSVWDTPAAPQPYGMAAAPSYGSGDMGGNAPAYGYGAEPPGHGAAMAGAAGSAAGRPGGGHPMAGQPAGAAAETAWAGAAGAGPGLHPGAAAAGAGAYTGYGAAARARSRPAAASQARRANLIVARLEPWSVMKFSFLMSLVAWLMLFVAVALLYYALSGLGVFAALQHTLESVTSSQGSGGVNLSKWTSAPRVLGYTMLIGAVNVVLITALSTVGAMIYNLVTHLGGGIEVTLKESD